MPPDDASVSPPITRPDADEVVARLAIVSDMHCHLDGTSVAESFLTVGGLRRLRNQHPVEALLHLVRIDTIASKADVLLMPGDFANRISQEGFAQAWSYTLEIAAALEAPTVVPALGNHDVDAYKLTPHTSPFHIAQQLHPFFPFSDQVLCDRFFASGSCLLNITPALQCVVVNTVVDQYDKDNAKRGGFGIARIEQLRTLLQTPAGAPQLHRVALMHHHPVLHTSGFISAHDVIDTGDLLLDALAEAGCTLVIHGHKHHARFRYADTSHGRVAVLAAGSFSAMLGRLFTETRNTFHIVDLMSATSTLVKGVVWTWEWNHATGWRQADVRSCGFPFRCGFSSGADRVSMRSQLVQAALDTPSHYVFYESELLAAVPDLLFLSPSDLQWLQESLLKGHQLDLHYTRAGRLELGRQV